MYIEQQKKHSWVLVFLLTASFSSLSLKGISPNAAYKKQQVSNKFLKT